MAHRGVHCIYERKVYTMTYAIVYASKTGNTRLLAETIRESLPQDSCLWRGGPDERALAALKAALPPL